MKNKIVIFAYTVAISSVLVLQLAPSLALAQNDNRAPATPTGFEQICSTKDEQGNPIEGAISVCIKKIYLFSLGFGALIALFMLVVAGYRYMTAGGNAEQVQAAKDTFETTFKGLIIIFTAFILLYIINPDLVQFTKLKLPPINLPGEGSSASVNPSASNSNSSGSSSPSANSAVDANLPPGIQAWSGQDPLGLIWGPQEAELKSALADFSSRWGSQVAARQVFRPPEYTNHIRSVWEAYQFIQGNAAEVNRGENCSGAAHVTQVQVAGYTQAQKDWVQAEAVKHAFVGANRTPPACRSDHEQGIAIDIYPASGGFPTGAEYSRYIRAGFDAGLCHNIAGDEPHFILQAGSGLSDAQCLVE